MLSNVNNYYLVLYTNKESFEDVSIYEKNKNIKIILREMPEFYNYKYKDNWISNQENSILNNKIDWELNMLWSEKIHFVKHTINSNYFNTEYYGWCDIGYFRNRNIDTPIDELTYWPCPQKVNKLNKDKIHYALVNNNNVYMNQLVSVILSNKDKQILENPIPQNQISVAGGFFIATKENIDWWSFVYDEMLKLYFEKGYVVKDDQMVIIDCIINNIDKFELYREQNNKDNWFMFQRILL